MREKWEIQNAVFYAFDNFKKLYHGYIEYKNYNRQQNRTFFIVAFKML